MTLPTPNDIALELLTLVEGMGVSSRKPLRMIVLTPAQMRSLSGRPALRGSVLKSVEGILHRRSVYLLSSRYIFVLAPFGAITKASPQWPDL